MAIRLLVPFTALPGKRDELITIFSSLAAEVHQEPGCEEYELYQSTTELNRMVLLEQWTDEDSLAAHAENNRQRNLNLNSLREGKTAPMERYIMGPSN